jgi:hypothetical protein
LVPMASMASDWRERIDQRPSYHAVFFRTSAPQPRAGEAYDGSVRLWARSGLQRRSIDGGARAAQEIAETLLQSSEARWKFPYGRLAMTSLMLAAPRSAKAMRCGQAGDLAVASLPSRLQSSEDRSMPAISTPSSPSAHHLAQWIVCARVTAPPTSSRSQGRAAI